jgi:hypothetical protein
MKTKIKDLKRGSKMEMEHTKSKKKATKIAKDHIKEHPLYYDKKVGLPAMEKKLTKIEKKCNTCKKGLSKCKCGDK